MSEKQLIVKKDVGLKWINKSLYEKSTGSMKAN